MRHELDLAPVAFKPSSAGLVDHHVGLCQVVDERRLGLELLTADATSGLHRTVVVIMQIMLGGFYTIVCALNQKDNAVIAILCQKSFNVSLDTSRISSLVH